MAIAAVGGASNQSTSNVSTLAVNYAPTAGHVVIFALSVAAGVTAVSVQDNLGNTLAVGPSIGTLFMFYQASAPSGVTSYTASWTTAVQCSAAVEEYSGVTGINISGFVTPPAAAGFAAVSLTSGTPSLTAYLSAPNNVMVAAFAAPNTLTTSVGTSRQGTTTSTAKIRLQDNTSAAVGNITNTCTQTTAVASIAAIELGGVPLARVEQDVILAANLPTSAKVHVGQDLMLVANSRTGANAIVGQNVLLVAVKNVPATGIYQPNVCVCT